MLARIVEYEQRSEESTKYEQEVLDKSTLTREIRYCLELFLSKLGDLDGLGLLAFSSGCHPLLVGMIEGLPQVVGHLRVQEIEDIDPGWTSVLQIH